MKVSDIFYLAIGKVLNTEEKVPLVIFAVTLTSKLCSVLCNLIYAVFGYVPFFWRINDFFNILSTGALIALAIYLILFFVKKRNPVHLVAGIFLLLSCFGATVFMWGTFWLVFAVCLAIPSLRDQEDEPRTFAKVALLSVVAVVALNWLSVVLWRLPQFFVGLYNAILAAAAVVEMALLLLLVLHEAEATGEVKSVVDGLVSKVKREDTPAPEANDSGDFLFGAPEMTEVMKPCDTSGTPLPVGEGGTVTVVPSISAVRSNPAVSGSGRYQYKTVAGPVGLTVGKNTNYAGGVKQYAAIIDREAVGGWTLGSIHEIPVTKRAGCLASLFGRADVTVYFNMLIFRKED